VTIASLDYWFYANTDLLLVTGWENVRSLQTMQHTFNGCSGITMLDMTKLDPSELTSVGYAFASCGGLQTIYVDGPGNYLRDARAWERSTGARSSRAAMGRHTARARPGRQ